MVQLQKRYLISPRELTATQVIDGADSTLDAMERAPVNPKNRPMNEIHLTHVSISYDVTCHSHRGVRSSPVLSHQGLRYAPSVPGP